MPEQAIDLLVKNLSVSRETLDRLQEYQRLIEKWQPSINLISKNTVQDIWQRHFLDSLQLLPLIPDKKATIYDIGTGAGFPGLALAMAGAPDVHLIESDTRKVAFLKEVSRITETPVTIHHGRIEELSLKPVEILVSRACAELKTLLALVFPLVSHGTTCLFHKGKNYSKEIGEAEKWSFDHQIIPSLADKEGVILKISDLRKR